MTHYNNDEEIKTVRAELRECRAINTELDGRAQEYYVSWVKTREALANVSEDIKRLRAIKDELVKALEWYAPLRPLGARARAALAKARGEV